MSWCRRASGLQTWKPPLAALPSCLWPPPSHLIVRVCKLFLIQSTTQAVENELVMEVIQIKCVDADLQRLQTLLEGLLVVSVGRICFLAAVWLLFSSVCQQSSLLPPPLYSLNPLRFHRASRYSRVSIATLTDMQQVSVSGGTGCSALPLAAGSAPGGSDWLAGPSGRTAFTERRPAD